MRPPLRLALGVRIENIGAGDHFRGGRCQLIKAQPRRRKRGGRGIDCGLQQFLQLHELVRSGFAIHVLEDTDGVADSLKHPRSQNPVVGKCEQSLPQCQQMAGKVSAVHGRDVGRSQRLQGLRVVPVVEVASVTFQCFHCMECICRTLDELSRRDVAEVVGGQICEKGQAHVGRRRAMCNYGNGILLKIVRGQPMIFRADEGFEKRPGLAGKLPEKGGLVSRQPCFATSKRPADPPGDKRRDKPESQYGPGHR